MPFIRPTLTDLRAQVAQDIASALPGTDPLLRFSNLNTMGVAQAGLANLHYGYLDWIARQSVPFTATDEFLEGWAGLIGITRLPATSASGVVTFTGAAGAVIPVGQQLVRGDGVTFTVQIAATVGLGGAVDVSATADADSTGATGAFGNCAAGALMTLSQAIAGIQSTGSVSTAFVGGADIESDDSLRTRMLSAYQSQPQGGAGADYVRWALEVPGVTRAWAVGNGFGAGTVVVYVMLDTVRAGQGGFPQGQDGVAADETRGTVAAGDQLLVAGHILPVQPVTALVYAVSPVANPIDFTINGIPTAAQGSIAGAINGVFQTDGAPGKTIPLAHVWSAIAAVSGVDDFVITSPTTDIANGTGELPTVGAIVYTQG
jgi:uncharacterized phage protein gp47/JayE